MRSGGRMEAILATVDTAVRKEAGAAWVCLLVPGDRSGEFVALGQDPNGQLPPVAELIDAMLAAPAAGSNVVTLLAFVDVAIPGSGDAPVGVIRAGWATGEYPRPGAAEVLAEIAALVAGAVEAEATAARERLATVRDAVLREIAFQLNDDQPVANLLERIPEMLGRVIAFDYVSFGLRDAGSGRFRLFVSHPGAIREPGALLPTEDVDFSSFARGRIDVVQYAVAKMRPALRDPLVVHGLNLAISAAVWSGGSPEGFLHVSRRTKLRFSEADEHFVGMVAALLTQSLANERRLHQMEVASARNRALAELALLLHAGARFEELFARLSDLLKGALGFDGLGLGVVIPGERSLLAFGSDYGAQPSVLPFEAVEMDEAMRRPPGLIDVRLTGNHPSARARDLARRGFRRSAFVLLRQGDEPLGVLNIARRSDLPFAEDERAFIEVLSALFRHAIMVQRRADEEARESATAQLLTQLSVQLDAGEPLEALFSRAEPLIREAVGADYVALYRREEDRDLVRMIGVTPGFNTGPWTTIPIEEIALVHLVPDQSPVVGFPLEESGVPRSPKLIAEGLVHGAAAFLRDEADLIGLLGIARRRDCPFDDRELATLDVVRQLVTRGVAQRLGVERVRREASEYEVIAEVASVVARAVNPGDITRDVLAPLARIVPEPLVTVGWVEDDHIRWLRSSSNHLASPIGGAASIAIETGQSVSYTAPDDPVLAALMLKYEVKAVSVTATGAADIVNGLLVVASREEGFQFTNRQLELFRVLAGIMGPAMAKWQALEETTRERALYNLILENLSEAVILLDQEYRAAYANPPGRLLLSMIDPGGLAQDLPSSAERLAPEVRAQFLRCVADRVPTRGRFDYRRDGEQRWLDYEFIPLETSTYRILAVVADTTDTVVREVERERHQEQLAQTARLAALGELITGVAHELNNPLTAILGFAEVIGLEKDLKFREEVDVIRKEALRARDVVRDLLSIAAPGPVEKRDVRVASLLGHIERVRRPAWQQAGIAVTVDHSRARAPIWAHEHQLTQVILNLITNAEYAVANTREPVIEVVAVTDEDGATITVRDNGEGMDDATRVRIFEPFFTTRRGTGTGLGLSLTFTIMASHDGRIEVQSAPGQGTTFTLRLPARPAPGGDVPSEADVALGARVLVIDDEPSLRRVCQRLVQSMGHTCDVAGTAEEAIALIRQYPRYDLVVCDYRLAGETADTIVREIEAIAPRLLESVIIATGAIADARVVELVGSYGLRLMAKPYGRDDFERLLKPA